MTIKPSFNLKEIPCPVCESEQSNLIGWRGGEAHQSGGGIKAAIVRCLKCSHQYPNPMPFPSGKLDDLYVDADQYFQGRDIDIGKQNGLRLIDEFEKRLGKKGNFLDVGCGTGMLLWAAKERGWEYQGIVPSTEFVEIARARFKVEAHFGNGMYMDVWVQNKG